MLYTGLFGLCRVHSLAGRRKIHLISVTRSVPLSSNRKNYEDRIKQLHVCEKQSSHAVLTYSTFAKTTKNESKVSLWFHTTLN